MTETLSDGVRRTVLTEAGIGGGPNTRSRPHNVQEAGTLSRNGTGGFSFKTFAGIFNPSGNGIGTRMSEPSATQPVIDWTDDESLPGRPGVSIGGAKGKASWLHRFLLQTGVEQNRRHSHDIEVVLPGKTK